MRNRLFRCAIDFFNAQSTCKHDMERGTLRVTSPFKQVIAVGAPRKRDEVGWWWVGDQGWVRIPVGGMPVGDQRWVGISRRANLLALATPSPRLRGAPTNTLTHQPTNPLRNGD